MKLIKGYYIPNSTEIKKAAAHLRRLEREKPNNYFDCTFLPESGVFVYDEFVDCHTIVIRDCPEFTIKREIGMEYDHGYHLRDLLIALQNFIDGMEV